MIIDVRPAYPLLQGSETVWRNNNKYAVRTIDFMANVTQVNSPQELYELWHFYNDWLDTKNN